MRPEFISAIKQRDRRSHMADKRRIRFPPRLKTAIGLAEIVKCDMDGEAIEPDLGTLAHARQRREPRPYQGQMDDRLENRCHVGGMVDERMPLVRLFCAKPIELGPQWWT